MRPDIVPTIEKYAFPPTPGGNGLDGRDTFVFTGHDHDFEFLVLDYKPDANFVKNAVYIVTGEGGAGLDAQCCPDPNTGKVDLSCVDYDLNPKHLNTFGKLITVTAESQLCAIGNKPAFTPGLGERVSFSASDKYFSFSLIQIQNAITNGTITGSTLTFSQIALSSNPAGTSIFTQIFKK